MSIPDLGPDGTPLLGSDPAYEMHHYDCDASWDPEGVCSCEELDAAEKEHDNESEDE